MPFTTLQTVANSKVKIRYKEPFASEGINKKFAVIVPAGPYRGLTLGTNASALSVTVVADPVSGDHVAVYETANGFSLRIRESAGDITLDLTALAPGSGTELVVIALFAEYVVGSDTTAQFRGYLWADFQAAAEKDELVVLGVVTVPASGVIPAASITHLVRTTVWESTTGQSLLWHPVLRNGGFELGETGGTYLHASPYWQASITATGTVIGPVDTEANSGDKCLELTGTAGAMTAQFVQGLDVPVTTGQLIKFQIAKKVLVAANASTGVATITLNFADKDGASLSNVASSIDIETIDGSFVVLSGIADVPTDVRVLRSVVVDVAGTYAAGGPWLRFDDVQAWVQAPSSLDWLPGDTRPSAEVATEALLIGPSTHAGNAALAKFAANTLIFTRRDGDTALGSQYETSFPGDLSAGGNANLQGSLTLGQGVSATQADADVARLVLTASTAGGVEYTLVSESVPTGVKGYRVYVSATDGSSIHTVNASYNNTTGDWTKDTVADEASRLDMGEQGIVLRWKEGATASWADAAWTRRVFESTGSEKTFSEIVGQTINPTLRLFDASGNSMHAVDHNGMPSGRISTFREDWTTHSGAVTSNEFSRWNATLVGGGNVLIAGWDPVSGYTARNLKMETVSNAINDSCEMVTNNAVFFPGPDTVFSVEFTVFVEKVGANEHRIDFGLGNGTFGATPGTDDGAWFTKDISQTNWQVHWSNAIGDFDGPFDTGIPPVVNTWQTFRIEWHGSNTSGGKRILFFINGLLRKSLALSGIPVQDWDVVLRYIVEATGGGSLQIQHGAIYATWNPMPTVDVL